MLLRLMHLMHMSMNAHAGVLMIGEVRETLLHGMQVARADGALQDLAPILLRETLNVRPYSGIAIASNLMCVTVRSTAAQCAPDVLRGAAAQTVGSGTCTNAKHRTANGAANATANTAANPATGTTIVRRRPRGGRLWRQWKRCDFKIVSIDVTTG